MGEEDTIDMIARCGAHQTGAAGPSEVLAPEPDSGAENIPPSDLGLTDRVPISWQEDMLYAEP